MARVENFEKEPTQSKVAGLLSCKFLTCAGSFPDAYSASDQPMSGLSWCLCSLWETGCPGSFPTLPNPFSPFQTLASVTAGTPVGFPPLPLLVPALLPVYGVWCMVHQEQVGNSSGKGRENLFLRVVVQGPNRVVKGGIECTTGTSSGREWNGVGDIRALQRMHRPVHVAKHKLRHNPPLPPKEHAQEMLATPANTRRCTGASVPQR